MKLWNMAYLNGNESEIYTPSSEINSTFKWVHPKPLDEVLDLFKPLCPFFANPSAEGFKTAFGGGRISSIQEGILKPSRNNQTAVFYLIYLLVQSNCL